MLTAQTGQARGWARRGVLGVALGGVLLATGCQTATGTGAAAGGAIGAGAGALLGRCPGAAVAGGLIGAGVGGLSGAAVDASREKKAERAAAADAAMRQPSPQDIVALTQSGVPDNQIINQIRTSGAVYRLTTADLQWLNQSGVHPAVITEMQDTAYRGARRVYVAPPPPVVVVEEPPPPPVGFGVGVAIRR
jgi:hypothetical protein